MGISKSAFWKKYLEPSDSLGEILFGLIMVLTFTLGTGLAAGDGGNATRTLLIGALGCNIAWGIIDGVMYVMTCLFQRGEALRFAGKLRAAKDEHQAAAMIARDFDDRLVPVSSETGRRVFYADVVKTIRSATPRGARITRDDIMGGVASFWLVFITALPAVIPFLLIDDARMALRTSNALLVFMLFIVGYKWGGLVTTRPWVVGLTMMVFGLALVGIAVALGG